MDTVWIYNCQTTVYCDKDKGTFCKYSDEGGVTVRAHPRGVWAPPASSMGIHGISIFHCCSNDMSSVGLVGRRVGLGWFRPGALEWLADVLGWLACGPGQWGNCEPDASGVIHFVPTVKRPGPLSPITEVYTRAGCHSALSGSFPTGILYITRMGTA
jgi:hypothetical protein